MTFNALCFILICCFRIVFSWNKVKLTVIVVFLVKSFTIIATIKFINIKIHIFFTVRMLSPHSSVLYVS